MIKRLGVENKNYNIYNCTTPINNKDEQNPSFKGLGVGSALLWAIQKCEENPMVNVAVVDMFSAILPRTFVESMTNWHAGFEAFRRESSGLVVNCIIPGAIAYLAGAVLSKFIMPKGINMSSCWADHSLIERLSEVYKVSNSKDKITSVFKDVLNSVEGVKGKDPVLFKDALKNDIESYAAKLKDLSQSNLKNKELNKEVEKIAKEIAQKTHIYENIKLGGKNSVKVSSLKDLLCDSVRFMKEYQKVGKDISIEEFAKKSKKLIKGKSALGLAIILPLAASMQYINRLITKKTSGMDGAPIYEDFGSKESEEVRKKSQEGLLKQKIISISSMIGVGLLSMMKMPSWGMLEFKSWFPTMDQARIISTTTFASRMAVADDKNELAEATIRDIATFSGLYFLGDYAGKAAATVFEKKKGIELLNDTKPIDKNANVFKKFWHWIKDVKIKSSEEVFSKLAETVKNPTAAQKAQIEKEIKTAKMFRSGCQVINLGVSLILLGFIVPYWTRSNTKKKHEEALKQVQIEKTSGVESSKEIEKETDKRTSETTK